MLGEDEWCACVCGCVCGLPSSYGVSSEDIVTIDSVGAWEDVGNRNGRHGVVIWMDPVSLDRV